MASFSACALLRDHLSRTWWLPAARGCISVFGSRTLVHSQPLLLSEPSLKDIHLASQGPSACSSSADVIVLGPMHRSYATLRHITGRPWHTTPETAYNLQHSHSGKQQGLQGYSAYNQHQQATMATSSTGSSAPVASAVSAKLASAVSLQLGAFWQKHKLKVYTGTAVVSVWLVWRLTYSLASSFITVTTTMAEWGFMGLAVGVVAAVAQYARWYYGLNPAAVYRQSMLRLNTSPAALEVLGAPLVGSDLRAYIVTGGNVYLSKKFRPKISSRRMQMIFPVKGAERDGLASVEVKRKLGRYAFKLLAVDVRPSSVGNFPGARVFIEGTPAIYDRGSILGELRDPFLKAIQQQKQLDIEEAAEEEAEEKERQAKKPGSTGSNSSSGSGGVFNAEQLKSWVQNKVSSAIGTSNPLVVSAGVTPGVTTAAVVTAMAGGGGGEKGATPAPGVKSGDAKPAADVLDESAAADGAEQKKAGIFKALLFGPGAK